MRDVAETIKTLEVQPRVGEFIELLFPDCEKAGLVDDEVRGQLKARRELVEKRSRVPASERRA